MYKMKNITGEEKIKSTILEGKRKLLSFGKEMLII